MADLTRDRVLAAAGEIFAEKGFHAATVREICRAAQVNLASVNYHFRDKESLYLETVQMAHRARMDQVPPPEWDPETPPDEKLRIYIRSMLQRMLATHKLQWSARLMMREMLQPTIACKPLVEEFIRPLLNQLLAILDELLPESVPMHRRHQIAFSIVGQCLHYRVAQEFVRLLVPKKELQAHFTIDKLAEHISQFSLAAIQQLHRRRKVRS